MGRARTWLIAPLALALASAGCASKGGKAKVVRTPLREAADATAKLRGSATGSVTRGSSRLEFRVEWSGGFLTGLGAVRGTLAAGGTTVPLDVRWRGGRVYVRRTVARAVVGAGPFDQVIGRTPGAALWAVIPATALASRTVVPFSPSDLVRTIDPTRGVQQRQGPVIGGAPTTRYGVTGSAGLLYDWIGPKDARVDVDGQGRIRRVEIDAGGGDRLRLDVSYSGATPAVRIPSARELRATAPAPPAPAGPFRTARDGTGAGVRWRVQRAPSSTGGTCWRLVTEPTLKVAKPNYGTDTRCYPPTDPEGDAAARTEFVLTTDGSAAANVVVAAVPKDVTTATLGFVGGRLATAPVTGGLLIWTGRSAEPLGYVAFRSAGVAVSCGIGAVSVPGDLTDDQLVGDPFGSAWLCQI